MFMAIFPYFFIGMFPAFGLIIVTKLLIRDKYGKKPILRKKTEHN
jgi:hypothetical protein